MNGFLLLVLLIVLGAMIAWSLRQRERMIQLPFLTAAAFIGFLLPQYTTLYQKEWSDPWLVGRLLLFGSICLLALLLGYIKQKSPARLFSTWSFDLRRLLYAAAVLVIAGVYFRMQINILGDEMKGAWTGPITIYYFLSQCFTAGFIISLLVFVRDRKNFLALTIIILAVSSYFSIIVLYGRRGPLVELALFLTLTAFFGWRWSPPRTFVLLAALAATLWFNSVQDYRMSMGTYSGSAFSLGWLENVRQVDFIVNLRRNFSTSAPELINALHIMDATAKEAAYDYGANFYNEIIRRYIPGQLIGFDVKQALRIEIGIDKDDLTDRYTPITGTTSTGLASSFRMLGFLGALQFFLIGYILSSWFLAAERGNLAAQAVVMFVTYSALRSFPMSSERFFLEFLNLGIFVLPALFYARSRTRPVDSPLSAALPARRRGLVFRVPDRRARQQPLRRSTQA